MGGGTFTRTNISARRLDLSTGASFVGYTFRLAKTELGKHEMVQAMYSYAWSEGLACLFFSRYNLTLQPDSVEYRFLIRELIEEFRHQEMFAMAIEKMNGKPIKPSRMHNFWGKLTVNYLPPSWVFMSVLAVEMIADVYGKIIRKNDRVYKVLRKVSELHHIEEGRHIYYTKIWLKRFTEKAGWIKRSTYSVIILLNIYFMRTLYVKQEIFERIGVDDPKKYQRAAYRHFRYKYADQCLKESIEFVHEFKGFNWFTRPLWKIVLRAKYKKGYWIEVYCFLLTTKILHHEKNKNSSDFPLSSEKT